MFPIRILNPARKDGMRKSRKNDVRGTRASHRRMQAEINDGACLMPGETHSLLR